MQLDRPTPSSILRKRQNQNQGDEHGAGGKGGGKRNRVRGRRVSFAPDDELETMHLFTKDDHQGMDTQTTTEPLGELQNVVLAYPPEPWGSSLLDQGPVFLPPDLHEQSPGPLSSPPSMELTNDTWDVQAAGPYRKVNEDLGPLPAREFTHSITERVPALSTLLEEDEEGDYDQVETIPCSPGGDLDMSLDITGEGEAAPRDPSSPGVFPSGSPDKLGDDLNLTDDQHAGLQKWGFVPGRDDTLDLKLEAYGRNVMGDVTFKHVYGESTGGCTTDLHITTTNRLPIINNPASTTGPPLGSVCAQASDAARGAPPAPVAPQSPAHPPHAHVAIGPHHHASVPEPAPAAAHQAGPPIAEASSPPRPLEMPPPVTPTMDHFPDGMTTNLLLDDGHDTEGWGKRLATGHRSTVMTGRGSVGSNVLQGGLRRGDTTTQLLGGTTHLLGGTTQLLGKHLPTGGGQAALEQVVQKMRSKGPLDQEDRLHRDDATTHLLADHTTSVPHNMMLADCTQASTSMPAILGKAPVPAAPAASPSMTKRHRTSNEQVVAMPSPLVGIHGGKKYIRAGEVTMELDALGSTRNLLEEQTLDDFALPPELGSGPAEMHLTLPFSGAYSHQHQGHSPTQGINQESAHMQVEPITFQDFLQLVDMQFLDHVRRGTSINVTDLAPDPPPTTLKDCLSLLTLTPAENEVYEHGVRHLQEAMQSKRSRLVEVETSLTKHNPRIFSEAQVAPKSVLEGLKRYLTLLKKSCRAQTMTAWKAMRLQMEERLTTNLQEQLKALQGPLKMAEEQLQQVAALEERVEACVEALGLEMDAEVKQHDQVVNNKEKLRHLRKRMKDMRAHNDDREERMKDLVERNRRLKVDFEALQQEKNVVAAQMDALQGTVGLTTPIRGEPAGDKLISRTEELDIITGLQSWQLQASPSDTKEWVLKLHDIWHCTFSVTVDNGHPTATGNLSVASGKAHKALSDVQKMVLDVMSGAIGSTFKVPAKQLPQQLNRLALALGRMCDVLDEMSSLMLQWPLLSTMGVHDKQLHLHFLDTSQPTKLTVALDVHLWAQQPRSAPPCEVQVHFCKCESALSESSLAEALKSEVECYHPLAQICKTVSTMLLGPNRQDVTGTPKFVPRKSLHFYDNPLYTYAKTPSVSYQ